MANFQITDKAAISAVDRAADLLLIYDASASSLKNVVVNTLLDLTSHPVGLTDVQSVTNKTLDVSNTVTFRDDRFTLQDNLDVTKQAIFQLSGITTGTIRTFTLPDSSTTVVGTTTTQTLTNKTLTSPTINTPTITNPTLTTDSVNEFTSANGVTVDGLNFKDGLVNTANSIDSLAYIDGSIDPEHLVTGSGTSWVHQSWTPVWTSLVVTGSTVTAKYTQIGKTVFYRFTVVLGGGNAPSGAVSFTLPVTSAAYAGTSTLPIIGIAAFNDSSATVYQGVAVWATTTTANILVNNASATYLTQNSISATVPFSFGNGDEIMVTGSYEAA